MKPLVNAVVSETLTDAQYTECFKIIEFCQNLENRNESIITAGNLLIQAKPYRGIKKKDQYKILWNELESFLRAYSDISEKHLLLYRHVKEIRQQHLNSENLLNYELSLLNNNGAKKPAQSGSVGSSVKKVGSENGSGIDIGKIMSLKARMAAMSQSNFSR